MAQIYANVSRINLNNHTINTSLAYQMKLVEEQFNQRLSNKQARSYQKAIFEKTGKEFSLHQLKSGAYSQDFWTTVKERRTSLMSAGVTGKALAATISVEFFGSQ